MIWISKLTAMILRATGEDPENDPEIGIIRMETDNDSA